MTADKTPAELWVEASLESERRRPRLRGFESPPRQ